MTERNVKRGMLVATIGVAGVLTALGMAGLMVVTRGPQAQALPLVRTLIAQDPGGTVAAETFAATTDHLTLTLPPPPQTIPTAPITASSEKTPGDSLGAANSQPSSSGSTGYTYIASSSPSPSAPPATSRALIPPASGAPASAPASAPAVSLRAGTASSSGSTISTSGPEAAGPVVSTTEPTTKPLEMKTEDPAEPDDDREVISPKLRVSTTDDHDPDEPDDLDDHGG